MAGFEPARDKGLNLVGVPISIIHTPESNYGRERIQTSDFCFPRVALYRTELLPDW